MQAWLQASGLWRLVKGELLKPEIPSPTTQATFDSREAWNAKADKAAGWLYLMVEPDQRVHFTDRDDPVKMWTDLRAVHLQRRPGTRFNAYDDLFNIRKAEDESLQSLINRVEESMKQIQNLRPDDIDLKGLDEELASMALIRALPTEEYSSFISSLLLKDKLDKAAVHQAFVTEDTQRRRRAIDLPSSSSALSAASRGLKTAKSTDPCGWCHKTGHTEAKCWRKDKDRLKAQEDTQNAPPRSKRRGNRANKAQEDSDGSPAPPASGEASRVTEFAGNTQVLRHI